jgi:hypothetical protein
LDFRSECFDYGSDGKVGSSIYDSCSGVNGNFFVIFQYVVFVNRNLNNNFTLRSDGNPVFIVPFNLGTEFLKGSPERYQCSVVFIDKRET